MLFLISRSQFPVWVIFGHRIRQWTKFISLICDIYTRIYLNISFCPHSYVTVSVKPHYICISSQRNHWKRIRKSSSDITVRTLRTYALVARLTTVRLPKHRILSLPREIVIKIQKNLTLWSRCHRRHPKRLPLRIKRRKFFNR